MCTFGLDLQAICQESWYTYWLSMSWRVLSEAFSRDIRPDQVKRDLEIQRVQDLYKAKALSMKEYLDKIGNIYKPKSC